MQAETGLEKLHGKGYMHGDISPYNIAVTIAEDGTTNATVIDLVSMHRPTDPEVC